MLEEGDILIEKQIQAREGFRIETRKWAVEQAMSLTIAQMHHSPPAAPGSKEGIAMGAAAGTLAKALEAYVMGDET